MRGAIILVKHLVRRSHWSKNNRKGHIFNNLKILNLGGTLLFQRLQLTSTLPPSHKKMIFWIYTDQWFNLEQYIAQIYHFL
jgi:hypothetical protein